MGLGVARVRIRWLAIETSSDPEIFTPLRHALLEFDGPDARESSLIADPNLQHLVVVLALAQ